MIKSEPRKQLTRFIRKKDKKTISLHFAFHRRESEQQGKTSWKSFTSCFHQMNLSIEQGWFKCFIKIELLFVYLSKARRRNHRMLKLP